jgi:D-alanyl-D-alanine carboxypeptidase
MRARTRWGCCWSAPQSGFTFAQLLVALRHRQAKFLFVPTYRQRRNASWKIRHPVSPYFYGGSAIVLRRSLLLSSALLLNVSAWPAPARPAEPAAAIDHRIQAAIQGFPGSVSLYATNLDTGVSYGLRADAPVPTASTIKLPIMVELFAEAGEGRLDWNQKLVLTDQDKVSGSGVLTEFSSGDAVPIRALMHLMIVVSDNTATNLILDRIGGNAVNVRMAQLGLKQTAVMRKIMQTKLFPDPNAKPHPEGVTDEGKKPGNDRWGTGRSCPRDMVLVLEKLYRGELVSKAASGEISACSSASTIMTAWEEIWKIP